MFTVAKQNSIWKMYNCVPRTPCLHTNMQAYQTVLTQWGRVMHICVGNVSIIGSDNGLSPARRQATIWTNVGILLGTNFSDIFFQVHAFENVVSKMAAILSRPQCVKYAVV